MAGEKVDAELQEFLALEQQRAQFQSQIHRIADHCWDLCIDKPRDKLDGKSETCVTNCVERFIDVSFAITGRFQQMLQRSLQGGH